MNLSGRAWASGEDAPSLCCGWVGFVSEVELASEVFPLERAVTPFSEYKLRLGRICQRGPVTDSRSRSTVVTVVLGVFRWSGLSQPFSACSAGAGCHSRSRRTS